MNLFSKPEFFQNNPQKFEMVYNPIDHPEDALLPLELYGG